MENLIIPKDEITENLKKELEKFKDLPDILKEDIMLLETKKYKKPKEILLSLLKTGKYETADSKSDKGYASKIRTFMNQLALFKKYKETDNVNWIIRRHRELVTELIKYNIEKKLSLSTFKTNITTILRILYLGYEDKNLELYKKFSKIQEELGKKLENKEKDNKLNENEQTRYLKWESIISIRNKIVKEYKESKRFDKNQDLILISLYTLTPPLRQEIGSLKFTEVEPTDKTIDYVYFQKNNNISLELYKEKKKHGYISIPLNYREEEEPSDLSKMILKTQIHLSKLLKESYENFKRENVFIDKLKYPKEEVAIKSTSQRLNKLFKDSGVNIGSSILRASYVTYINNLYTSKKTQLTSNEKDELAIKFMRTSKKQLEDAYNKILPIEDVKEVELEKIEEVKNKKLVETTYEKHVKLMKENYQNSKKLIVEKDGVERETTEAKEYKRLQWHKSDKEKINRQKILREYKQGRKLKQETIDKYEFTAEELKI